MALAFRLHIGRLAENGARKRLIDQYEAHVIRHAADLEILFWSNVLLLKKSGFPMKMRHMIDPGLLAIRNAKWDYRKSNGDIAKNISEKTPQSYWKKEKNTYKDNWRNYQQDDHRWLCGSSLGFVAWRED